MSKKNKKSNYHHHNINNNNTNHLNDDYFLILKPKNHYCKFNQTISISFCQNTKSQKHKHNKTCLECPVFNKDYNFGSPSFILKSEQVFLLNKNSHIMNKKVKKSSKTISEKCSIIQIRKTR